MSISITLLGPSETVFRLSLNGVLLIFTDLLPAGFFRARKAG